MVIFPESHRVNGNLFIRRRRDKVFTWCGKITDDAKNFFCIWLVNSIAIKKTNDNFVPYSITELLYMTKGWIYSTDVDKYSNIIMPFETFTRKKPALEKKCLSRIKTKTQERLLKLVKKKVIKELENRAKNPSSRVSYLIVKRKEKYTPYSQQTQ